MFKKVLTLIIGVELAILIYLLGCIIGGTNRVIVKPAPPSDDTCQLFIAKENDAWLENMVRIKRNTERH